LTHRAICGHANLSQTSTYLHAAEMGRQESMRKFDAGRLDESSTDFRGKQFGDGALDSLPRQEAEKR
jgi:hypothetical protein